MNAKQYKSIPGKPIGQDDSLSEREFMKIARSIYLFVFILCLFAIQGQARASGLLFVYGGDKVGQFDEALIDRLEEKGFEVVVKKDGEVGSYHAEGQEVVVISGTVGAGKIATREFRNLDENIICLNPELFADLGLTGDTKESDFGYTSPLTELEILDSSHPLAASFSGMVKVGKKPIRMAWGSPSGDGFCIASPEAGSGKCGILAYEAGTAMLDQTAPARRVGLFPSSREEVLTEEGLVLFDTAVDWAVQHVDDDFAAQKIRNVADFMGWKSAPDFTTDIDYTSSGAWESSDNLPVINYEPSHYPHFKRGVNNQYTISVKDDSFQKSLKTDLPFYDKVGGYIEYMVGNPEVTIYNDLKKLKAQGFKGVRLYASDPKTYVNTIQSAYDLGMKVYLTVDVPDLSNWPLKDMKARRNDLFNILTRQGPDEGSLQCLHYIISVVGKSVFSATVPLVFFGNEKLLQPKSLQGKDYTDANCTVPELRWGINLTRALLAGELQNEPHPAVTTAILAGQITQVSLGVHTGVAKLVETIRHDSRAPISYTVYPFQWGSRYFDADPQPYNSSPDTIPNAYPKGAKYYDRCKEAWNSGLPNFNPGHSVREMVMDGNAGNIKFSLKWTVDMVNWIWGGATPGGTVKQIIAETGWPSERPFSTNGCPDPPGRMVEGKFPEAKEYFLALKDLGFKVENCPVMYFYAFDEPLKEPNDCPNRFSEKHFGIYGWSGIPKFFPETLPNPLLQPFVVFSIASPNGANGFPQMKTTDTSASDIQFSVSPFRERTGTGNELQVPWYFGADRLGDTKGGTICYFPPVNMLVSQGEILTVTTFASFDKKDNVTTTITIKNSDGSTLSYVNSDDAAKTRSSLQAFPTDTGLSYKLWMNYWWTHGQEKNTNQNVFADWWAQ